MYGGRALGAPNAIAHIDALRAPVSRSMEVLSMSESEGSNGEDGPGGGRAGRIGTEEFLAQELGGMRGCCSRKHGMRAVSATVTDWLVGGRVSHGGAGGLELEGLCA